MPPIPKKPTKDNPSEPSPSGPLAMAPKQSTTGGEDINERGFGKRDQSQSPVAQLATAIDECGPNGSMSNSAFERHLAAPSIKLAHVVGAQGDNVLIGQRGVDHLPDTSLPALLISYYYLEAWELNKHKYHYRDWVMDSGAFSAHNSGAVIVLQDYIDCCHRLMKDDPTLTEVYSLDVIGDWKASLKNTEEMWRQGVPAIPCYHAGEPWEVLVQMAKDYPKIALGGVALAKSGKKMKWAAQCFARIWPKKIHGFAFGSETAIMTLPFHSVDATNWELGPCKYGTWRGFGGQRISVRGSQQNLRVEVEWYLELERKARERWKKEMQLLDSLDAPAVRHEANGNPGREDAKTAAFTDPTIRLVGARGGGGQERINAGLERESPTVRLAVDAAAAGGKRITALLEE